MIKLITFIFIFLFLFNSAIGDPGTRKFIDLHLRQQHNGVDCGLFTVDNLIRLARYAHDNAETLDGLDRDAVIEAAGLQHPPGGDAAAIRAEHNDIFPTLGLPAPIAIEEKDFASESGVI